MNRIKELKRSYNGIVASKRIGSEKFGLTDTFDSFDDYWIKKNPQAVIDDKIGQFGINVHLKGKQVVYGGKECVSGGVHPLDHNVIKIYKEGLNQGDRHFIETVLEEIHHSKLMGIRPYMRKSTFSTTWNDVVEPWAKDFAKRNTSKFLNKVK